jgi:hypothetical protein
MTTRRWVSSAAVGTETARFNQMREVKDWPRDPDPDEGPFYVLASDYEKLHKRLMLKLPNSVTINGVLIGKGCTLETVASAISLELPE